MDFFSVPTLTFHLLYCFFIISHDRRRILHLNVTRHPTSSWLVQQLRDAFPYDVVPRFLVFDHDAKYGLEVPTAIRSTRIACVQTSSFSLGWWWGFVHGLMGFLRYAEPLPEKQTEQTSAGQLALLDYANQGEAAEEPESKASALQLAGILEFARKHAGPSEQFDMAYQLVPYNSDARNLAAMFRLYRDYTLPGKNLRARDTANDFIAAIALQPRNTLVLGNLESFYELLTTPAAQDRIKLGTAIEPSEIEAQLKKLKAIRQRLAETPAPAGE